MNKERELLREIYADLEYDSKLPLWLRDRVRDCLSSTSDDAEELELEEYDAGLLGYFGGGDVEWWQDYIRDLLGRAHDHYQSQVSAHPPKPAESEAEPVVYINLDEKRLEWAVPFEFKSSCFVLGKLPLYLHPPNPAEPEAEEPVAWGYKDRWGDISDCISCQSAKDAGTKGDFTIPLYLHPPKPAEPAARKPRGSR